MTNLWKQFSVEWKVGIIFALFCISDPGPSVTRPPPKCRDAPWSAKKRIGLRVTISVSETNIQTLFIHFVDCGFGSLDNRMQHVKSTQPYFKSLFRIITSPSNRSLMSYNALGVDECIENNNS